MASPYRLIVTQLAREQFRALGRSSVYTGRRDEVSRAMR